LMEEEGWTFAKLTKSLGNISYLTVV